MTNAITIEYIPKNKTFQISSVYSNQTIGIVHDAGLANARLVVYEYTQLSLEEIIEITNFMKIGPCPLCAVGYVAKNSVVEYCTNKNCNYVLGSG